MPSKTSDVKGMKTYQTVHLAKDKNVFIAVGKTSPWNTENPEKVPDVSYGQTITEIVALKRADQVRFVTPDDTNGTIEQQGHKWRIIDEDEARLADCRWVYVQAWLRFDEFPICTYRQTGVYAGTILADGLPINKQVVKPDEVKDMGFLLAVTNQSPLQREATHRESIEYILEL
ncbi:hypothetical protein [Brevibacillus sp. BC25]|uniref:hypothetical protein n=1 Tax=Brevibacillus sp. BC25 TaxID=1144308 RepID=UPI00027128FA|nr:hypothetical protein [Brevibacillus sp. BC25]EJL29937.1 hypothetical protein PMI05_01552 [Brevibacillus sp. BC25]